MTPEEARARLKTKGRDLTRKERKALNTIAGMHAEYAVQGKAPNSDEWITLSQWSEELPSSDLELEITLTDEDTGERWQIDTRIIVRYVTAPQPLGEEQ